MTSNVNNNLLNLVNEIVRQPCINIAELDEMAIALVSERYSLISQYVITINNVLRPEQVVVPDPVTITVEAATLRSINVALAHAAVEIIQASCIDISDYHDKISYYKALSQQRDEILVHLYKSLNHYRYACNLMKVMVE